ncbi:hypothetical protein AC249_AIPGENE10702 [Exaiptasia diaphana]|nr:hypothetical protein AC249_AIPGENE10702 [Exaiptasia diaphana]
MTAKPSKCFIGCRTLEFLGHNIGHGKLAPEQAITAPLTDLTKNGKPNQVVWEDSCERALNSVKQRHATSPVLRLPHFTKEFIVRSDASDDGLGDVLLHEYDAIAEKLELAENCNKEKRRTQQRKKTVCQLYIFSAVENSFWRQTTRRSRTYTKQR